MNKILPIFLIIFSNFFTSLSYANCRLVDRTINLQEAYPFVIFPTTVNIKDAEGECSVVQAETHGLLINNVARIPLQCVPVEFTSMSILFEDENGQVIQDTLPNAIATRAACR
ncbi:TGF-beta family protein [Microbulbifer spongiae]|uniref:TGF-beta family protein n=1 Tax=Microbulbifer spongiae TaxID=2944933 RepID=A0ABY9EE69_9GAMM|nr:TGF-beta family protein [Microbulbifer sp. MI-G]WKD49655.1 TGF-beta family protein [Microbulbifer sp. MI-G]